MPKLTVGRMAKLYEMHRSSLYEALAKGRVSFDFNGRGQRVIDLSEMIRVYGEPSSDTRHLEASHPTPDIQTLQAQIAELIRVVEAQSKQMEGLREEVAGLKALPAPENAPAQDSGEKVKSLEDVLARFEARRR